MTDQLIRACMLSAAFAGLTGLLLLHLQRWFPF